MHFLKRLTQTFWDGLPVFAQYTLYHLRTEMRQSLASQSFINNERLFKESQESYSKKNQNVSFFLFFLFFSFLVSNANANRVILFYEQWQVCNGSVLRFFAIATVYFSHDTSVTTLFLGR